MFSQQTQTVAMHTVEMQVIVELTWQHRVEGVWRAWEGWQIFLEVKLRAVAWQMPLHAFMSISRTEIFSWHHLTVWKTHTHCIENQDLTLAGNNYLRRKDNCLATNQKTLTTTSKWFVHLYYIYFFIYTSVQKFSVSKYLLFCFICIIKFFLRKKKILLFSKILYIYTVSHRSEYTPHIFANIFTWQHWRNDTLLQCKVVNVQLV